MSDRYRMTALVAYVTIADEDGHENTLEMDDSFEANGKEYAWLAPIMCEECAEEHGESSYLFRVEEEGDELIFIGVTDEIEARSAAKVYDALCEEE